MAGIDCPECEGHAVAGGWALVHACASVGIEHGRTTGEEIGLYLAAFHRNGHRAAA